MLDWIMNVNETTVARYIAAWPGVCARLAAGDLVRDILRDAGFERNSIYAYLARNPQAKADWDMARETSADSFMDEALVVARTPTADSTHARTHVDTLKWAARIRNPRFYSDKQSIDVNVRTVDLTRIIQDANARVAALRATQGVAIEGVATRVLEGALSELL